MTFLEKINQLPAPIATFFLSDNQRHELEKSCYIYGVDDDRDIGKIAFKLGQLYIGEIKLKDLPSIINKETNLTQKVCYGLSFEINKRIFNRFSEYYADSSALLVQWASLKSLPLISEDQAWKKVLEAEPWIIDNEKEEREQKAIVQKKIDNINIDDALVKYLKLGEQQIANNPVKLRQFANSVRPSIKNWITDYHDNMGGGKHSSIDRGNYLFHSENGKKLTPIERRKLSAIMRSLDEKTPLSIDSEAQVIVFSAEDVDTEKVPMQGNQPQESVDIFQRYVSVGEQNKPKQSFSPNFAAKQTPQPDEKVKAELRSYFTAAQSEKPVEKSEPKNDEYQLPQSKPKIGSDNYFSKFASSGAEHKQTDESTASRHDLSALAGTVSFSSPQKLPVEQSVNPVKPAPQPKPQSQPKPRPIVKPLAEKISHTPKFSPQQSQWHIEPARHFYEENEDGGKDSDPKISGNVVDLRS